MIDLTKLSTRELVALYNQITSGTTQRFESHAIGVERVGRKISQLQLTQSDVYAAMTACGIETPPMPNCGSDQETGTESAPEAGGSSEGSLPATEATIKGASVDSAATGAAEEGSTVDETPKSKEGQDLVDRRILDILKALGPCKIGAMRERWKAEDANFRTLAPTQQKGVMRRAVRRLEESGKIKKDGQTLPALPCPIGGPAAGR
ncbi:hypothetical protein [Azospirillum aestuarii]|uniref:hypothetical protein n=1 Tax=Azospirillum aestuarii TaxID=2802052 RepID=UPI004054F2EE